MGFNRPSKIQESALPMLLADPPADFIAQSQSGTGKTAAFVLAMLSRVNTSKKHPQVHAYTSMLYTAQLAMHACRLFASPQPLTWPSKRVMCCPRWHSFAQT